MKISFRMKESSGWKLSWTSPHIEDRVEHIALNTTKVPSTGSLPGLDSAPRMVAAAYGTVIQLWSVHDNGDTINEIGNYHIKKD